MPAATLDGRRVHWLDQGEGQPALVLLHAFPSTPACGRPRSRPCPPTPGWWRPTCWASAPRSSPTNRQLLGGRLGLPGGRLIEHLGLGPVVLGGLSMGGYVAFAFVRRHRSRLAGLVLAEHPSRSRHPGGGRAPPQPRPPGPRRRPGDPARDPARGPPQRAHPPPPARGGRRHPGPDRPAAGRCRGRPVGHAAPARLHARPGHHRRPHPGRGGRGGRAVPSSGGPGHAGRGCPGPRSPCSLAPGTSPVWRHQRPSTPPSLGIR